MSRLQLVGRESVVFYHLIGSSMRFSVVSFVRIVSAQFLYLLARQRRPGPVLRGAAAESTVILMLIPNTIKADPNFFIQIR